MRKAFRLLVITTLAVVGGCSPKVPDGFIAVDGGAFVNTKSAHYGKAAIPAFYIGKYEVTQQEWIAVMGDNPSQVRGGNLPVETVSWYDCVAYCNARSTKEGLQPYYTIDKTEKKPRALTDIDDVNWTVAINAEANGYRLPTEAEWEYAASGGQRSKSYTYSGSNAIEGVAWYWRNAGDAYLTESWSWPLLVKNHNQPKPVGSKAANELGIYDMSGNVREWCWDWYAGNGPDEHPGRIWKGGGWIGADFCCEPSFRASYEANGKAPDQGFRVCRSR